LTSSHILLQSFGAYEEIGELSVATGRIQTFPKDQLSATAKISGQFARAGVSLNRSVSPEMMALYLYGDDLWVQVGARRIAVTSEIVVHVVKQDMGRILEVRSPDEQIMLSVAYVAEGNSLSPEAVKFDWTMTDEEDFDFGLWVSNVLMNGERRRLLVDTWS
jgi:hypothetical protein